MEQIPSLLIELKKAQRTLFRANEAVRDGASALRNWRLQSCTPSEHPRRGTFYVAFDTFDGI
jgi:hypothetical protein